MYRMRCFVDTLRRLFVLPLCSGSCATEYGKLRLNTFCLRIVSLYALHYITSIHATMLRTFCTVILLPNAYSLRLLTLSSPAKLVPNGTNGRDKSSRTLVAPAEHLVSFRVCQVCFVAILAKSLQMDCTSSHKGVRKNFYGSRRDAKLLKQRQEGPIVLTTGQYWQRVLAEQYKIN